MNFYHPENDVTPDDTAAQVMSKMEKAHIEAMAGDRARHDLTMLMLSITPDRALEELMQGLERHRRHVSERWQKIQEYDDAELAYLRGRLESLRQG